MTEDDETVSCDSLIIKLAAAPLPKFEHPHRCATCDNSFFATNPADGKQSEGGYCRLDPPKCTSFLVPPAVQGGQPRDLSVGAWPIVFKNQFCTSGYRRKAELTQ